MKKWMNYARKKFVSDNIVIKDTYGDWIMPPERPELIHSVDPARKTDGSLLGTSFYFRSLCLLERFAALQGFADDVKAFADEAAAVKDAYNSKFFNSATAQYSNSTVTANILSICYGLVPDGFEERVFANIVDKTANDFDSHVSVGLVGMQWLMRCLSDHGRADLAFKIVTNRDYPSWGYMIENGATTIWELWNGNTADPAMCSHNHVCLLGDVIVWFYEYLAGIRNEAGFAGFERIVMKPYPVDGLDFVNASYRSVRGLVESRWKKQEGQFIWNVVVPANTAATIYIPATNPDAITESGRPVASVSEVTFLKMEAGYAVFKIGSGAYEFAVKD
jgi:alpha-L-rhamnosidase